MTKRPLSVTVVSAVYLIAGVVGLSYHFTELKMDGPVQYELLLVLIIRVLAIVCGFFMLRAANWARWLAVIWMAYHVILSFYHTYAELLMHAHIFVAITYFLFRRPASLYFSSRRVAAPVEIR